MRGTSAWGRQGCGVSTVMAMSIIGKGPSLTPHPRAPTGLKLVAISRLVSVSSGMCLSKVESEARHALDVREFLGCIIQSQENGAHVFDPKITKLANL